MKLQKTGNTKEKKRSAVMYSTHTCRLELERRDDFRSARLGKQNSRSQEFEKVDQKRLELGMMSYESNQNDKKIFIER